MKRSKGQAAMEFLMTYGWAILVVLVAIGALAYFGVLDPDKLIADKCVIAPGSGVSCDDYGAAAAGATTDAITVVIKNVGADTILITDVGITGCSEVTDANVTAGATGQFDLDCTAATTAGKIKSDLTVKFEKTAGVTKTAVGDLVITIPAA